MPSHWLFAQVVKLTGQIGPRRLVDQAAGDGHQRPQGVVEAGPTFPDLLNPVVAELDPREGPGRVGNIIYRVIFAFFYLKVVTSGPSRETRCLRT